MRLQGRIDGEEGRVAVVDQEIHRSDVALMVVCVCVCV
jgi:hypothetical protein